VERTAVLAVTAQGAAFDAGLAVGIWDDYRALVDGRPIDRVFEPGSGAELARDGFSMWTKAVERAKHWAE
jgi:glycerol kinase